MKPEAILKSDVLDILFENRNKDYGAYALRKNYNVRLVQALGVTLALVAAFFILQSMKFKNEPPVVNILTPDPKLITVLLAADKPEDKPVAKEKEQKPLPTIDNSTPVIKDDIDETTVNSIDSMEGRNISNVTNDVPSEAGDGQLPFTPQIKGGGTIIPVTKLPETEQNVVWDHADIMPSFNGDVVKFMLRHLRQPENLDDGERIVVRVKFVVTAEGNISDIQVIQSGRHDLDAEVVRVVKKMPKWNPGKQGGRSVPVYFNLPVTFVSNAE